MLLTIVVPFFQSEKDLGKCLACFAKPEYFHRLEVIAVDNGSTDSSRHCAEKFVNTFPEIFRIVTKPNNGQHGAAINLALDTAIGRFFRVIDADDWVNTVDLESYLSKLNEIDCSVDIVITNFRTIDKRSGRISIYATTGIPLDRSYTLDQLIQKEMAQHLQCCTFHGTTYRTDFLKSIEFHVSENLAFEDREYASIPFIYARKIHLMDCFLYQYQVGSKQQGGSDQGLVLKAPDLEMILWKINDCYQECHDRASRCFLEYKMQDIVLTLYVAWLIKQEDKVLGRQAAMEFKCRVSQKIPEIARSIEWKYLFLAMLNYLYVGPYLLNKVKQLGIYKRIRKYL